MPWWESYFGELYLRLLATMYTEESTAQEVAGVVGLLDLAPGARILDLACGQGRHALPLARLGYRVTGLDRSSYLLDRARQAALSDGLKVQWIRGDMRNLPCGQAFDACLSLFTSFGYFDKETENRQVLHQVQRVLYPGGVFFLDVANRDHCLLRLWPSAWRRFGPAYILEETGFDLVTGRSTSSFTWLEGGHTESLTHSVRYYTPPELVDMLEDAGLLPAALYGGFDGSSLGLNSNRLIVVAKKQ